MEETEGAHSAPGTDASAMALGLAGASRAEADAFLRDQRRLIALQAEELSHELGLRHWSAWVRHISSVLKLTLELGIALLLLALAAGISLMVWNAAHSEGLIVESFSVPPDLAARGLTGQVIAGQLTDKLSQLQAATDSNRAPRSYSNDWGDDIKVEIPDTGVSIGEAYRFLRKWLGHETHVSGDVWRAPAGLAIAARVNGGGGTTTGSEADLDGLIQKAAEDIYGRTQPYRYAVYLSRHGRKEESGARFRALAQSADTHERAWANFALSVEAMDTGAPAEQERLLKLAAPHGVALANGNLALLEEALGRLELARSYYEKADALMQNGGGDLNPDTVAAITSQYAATRHWYRGDYRAAVQEIMTMVAGTTRSVTSPSYRLAQGQLLDHDVAAARKTLENPVSNTIRVPGAGIRVRFEAQMAMAQATEDWNGMIASAQAMNVALQKYPGQVVLMQTADDPQTALAEAKQGKFSDAERRIAKTPPDCYPCLLARARIADLQGQQARSDEWFARAIADAPSIPIAEAQWGLALLGRHQPDAAIEKFKLSNQKGAHFADPLEGWGEALMAESQSHLALAKFAEAEKYAPNWGRLHLKWGEALVYAGKPAEAKAQFTRAAGLGLTSSEKSELARAPRV